MLNLARKALAKRPVLAQNVALAQGVAPNGPAAAYLWPRRAFHLLVGSTIPLAVLFLPYDAVLWLLIVLSIAMVLVGAALLCWFRRLPAISPHAQAWEPPAADA